MDQTNGIPAACVSRTSQTSEHWNTPGWIVERVMDQWGRIGTDPCWNEGAVTTPERAIALPTPIHEARFMRGELPSCVTLGDGTSARWDGLAFVNPPYGRAAAPFAKRCAAHGERATAILLVPARPDTAIWHDLIWPRHNAIAWLRGRVTFPPAKQAAPFAAVLVLFAEGSHGADARRRFSAAFADVAHITERAIAERVPLCRVGCACRPCELIGRSCEEDVMRGFLDAWSWGV